jgi:hypothetical protein
LAASQPQGKGKAKGKNKGKEKAKGAGKKGRRSQSMRVKNRRLPQELVGLSWKIHN